MGTQGPERLVGTSGNHGAVPTMGNPNAAIPVFSAMSYITTGDPYADAYSGEQKVEQAATMVKTPFASGLVAASRHRGMQFKNSPQKSGKGFLSANVGDPYIDGFKRTHRHYQRSGASIPGPQQFKPSDYPKRDLPTHMRATGVMGSGSTAVTFGGTIEHTADHGAMVAVPTRNAEQYESYLDVGTKKRAALQSKRIARQVRRCRCCCYRPGSHTCASTSNAAAFPLPCCDLPHMSALFLCCRAKL